MSSLRKPQVADRAGLDYVERRLSFATALEAGASPLLLSPDYPLLVAQLRGYPRDHAGRAGVRLLAEYFLRLGKRPRHATRHEVNALCGDAIVALPASVRTASVSAIAGFYQAIDAPELTQVARHADVPAGSAIDALRFYGRWHGGVARTSMRRLAAFFETIGKRPLEAEPGDVIDFLGLQPRVGDRQRVRHRTHVRNFYREQLAAGRVSRAVAIAAGVPRREIEPTFWELRIFGMEEGRTIKCRQPLNRLASFLERHETHPLAVTPDQLRTFFEIDLAPLTPMTMKSYRTWVTHFYRDLSAVGLVSPSQALAARVKPELAEAVRGVA